MHMAYARETIAPGGEAHFRASFPPAPPALPVAAPVTTGGYGAERRPNLPAIAAILALHAVALVGLVKADVISLHKKAPPPLVIDLMTEPPAPPPPPATPEPEVRPVKPVQPQVVSPPPIVSVPTTAPPIAVVAEAPPPQAVVVAPAPKAAAASSAPVSVDLSANLIYTKAPKIPTESRRRRESGTVTLWVVLNDDGRVGKISVSQSSGYDALDKAALDAVRQWRWRPTIHAGEAVAVAGKIPITFNVTG